MTAVMVAATGRDDAPVMTAARPQARITGTFARLCAEHRRALDRLTAVEHALHVAAGGEHDERTLRAMHRYLAEAFGSHLAFEERVVFPALLEQLPELTRTLAVLHAEHETLGELRQQLSELLAQPRTPRRTEQLGVLGRDLADLMRLHIQKEQRAVLDWSERVLAEPARAELERRLRAGRGRRPPHNPLQP
jgi:hemerythrin-like domain-containing protein